jgi:RNA polymerase sigma factor (sigma-70 family)
MLHATLQAVYAIFRLIVRNCAWFVESKGCPIEHMGHTITHSDIIGRREPSATSIAADVVDAAALSFNELVEQYGRLVASAARRVVGPRGDVDDVVQETWITYLKSGNQIADSRCLGGWLYRVATRIALRSQQRSSKLSFTDDVALVGDRYAEAPDVETDLLRTERQSAVRSAGGELHGFDRDLLELLLDEADYGYREISERCGVPIGSLGPTRERLIRKLRSVPAVQRLADCA